MRVIRQDGGNGGFSWTIVVFTLLWTACHVVASDSLVRYMPDGALATIEIAHIAPLLERIEKSPVLQQLLVSPQWQEALKQDGVQKALAMKAIAEAQLRMSLWEFARTALSDRTLLAIYPPSAAGSQPDGVLLIQVAEASSLQTIWDRLSPLLVLAGDKIKVSQAADKTRTITLDNGHQVVIRDRWVLVATSRDRLDQTLARLSETSSSPALDAAEVWQQFASQVGTNHHVQLCLNMNALQQLAGHRPIPEKLDNGLVSLVLGGYLELAGTSPYVASTIDVTENQIRWRTSAAGDGSRFDAAHQALLPTANSNATEVPPVSAQLMEFSLQRDFASWYRHRESLLDAKLLPGFDKFETGLATFLPGKDFGEDVLPLLGDKLRLIVAPQDYSHLKGKPGVRLPAFALVLNLARPAEANDLLTLVFQTIIGISNLQAMQEGRQPFVLTSETHQGVQISFAKYLKLPEGDTLPISANFQPASARAGSHFLLTTNVALCRQLIDIIQQTDSNYVEADKNSSAATQVPRDFAWDLSPSIAADLLESNRSVLEAQGLQQGKSADQAKNELDTILALLRQLTPVSISSFRYPDHWDLEFSFGWK